jgi:protein-S-isoprenylcysteine O-methyltransferase Ste14
MTIDERTLGRVQARRRQVVVIAILTVAASLLVVAPRVTGDSPYHDWIEFAGFLAILAAICLRLWCTLYIGDRKSDELVTTGPYSLCRNPLYVGSMIGAVGVGLQTGMASFALLCGLICWAIFAVVVRREEAFLHGRFGPIYARYCARTPRFWPRFDRYDEGAGAGFFTTRSLKKTLRDGAVFLLALPLTELIENLHEAGVLPALISLY